MSQKNKLIDVVDESPLVTVEEFKRHIKWELSDSTEDTLMASYLTSASKQAELITRRILQKSSWKTFLDEFPSKIRLEVNPIDIESVVVQYYDTDNAIQTLADTEYFIHDNGPDDFIEIEFNGERPSLFDKFNVIEISYTAGYGSDNVEELPEMIKVAIMKRAAKDFQHRVNGDAAPDENEFYRDLFMYKMLWVE